MSEESAMKEQVQARLAELRREYEVGQRRLQELVAQEVALRETLLRISGAVQVLEELSGSSAAPAAPGQAVRAPEVPEADGMPAEPPAPGTVLTVG